MDFTPPFGAWLKAQRAKLDLTQGDLARRVGYSPETIRKIEAGALKPSKQIVDLLADHLGVPPAQRDAFLAFATDARTAKAEPTPSNLPIPATQLLGRESDMASVRELLQTRSRTPLRSPTPATPVPARLVTLLGPPGVGKTRLAIEVAREVKDDFLDGAWFVALAPVTEPQAALATILQALDAQSAPGLPPLDALKRHLRERELLLVLDNLEQVLDVAPFIAEILSAAPKVKMLATSREPLRIAAEQRYTVQPLVREPAVALFVQRAKAVQPEFVPTPEVSAICAKLDGLPLAIELAAARVEAFTPKELLARLDKRLSTLTSGGRDLPERQRTLRATIEWSYQLLSKSEQALLRRLAVFSGGCTLKGIESVCQPEEGSHDPLIETVASLVAKNLLNRDEGANGQSRYRMLEMIREYASEKLGESSEADQWRLRHAEYYQVLAQAVPTNYFSEIESNAVEHLQPELDNLRAAITWCLATPEHAEIGFRLIPAMSACSLIHGGLDAELKQLQRISAQSFAAKRTVAWATALEAVATSLGVLGNFSTAYNLIEESLRVSRELNDAPQTAYLLCQLGRIARERGDMPTARVHLEESMDLCRELGDSVGFAGALVTLGEVAVMQEDIALATDLLKESLTLFEKDDHLGGSAWTLNHLGHVAQLQGDYARAVALHEQSLPLLWRNGQLMGPAHAFESLGETALSQGDASRAKAHYVESLVLFRRLGDKEGIAWCLTGFAGAAAFDEEPERGARLWGAGEGLREQIGCRIAPASRLNRERTVALLREQLGDERFEAEQAIGRAMTLEQAVAYALGTPDLPSQGRTAYKGSPEPRFKTPL